jgi:hypothetical protein
LIRSLNEGRFGEQIFRPFLSALAGLEPGTPEFEQYVLVAQTLVDSTDGGNWAAEIPAEMPIIHNQVIDDDTVPNTVPGAPLAGSEPMNRLLGLASYSSTQMNPDGLRGVARFLQPAEHGSWLSPTYPAVRAEMQGQTASFLASDGTAVVVGNPDLLEPTSAPAAEAEEPRKSAEIADVKRNSKAGKGKSRIEPVHPTKDRGVNNHD